MVVLGRAASDCFKLLVKKAKIQMSISSSTLSILNRRLKANSISRDLITVAVVKEARIPFRSSLNTTT